MTKVFVVTYRHRHGTDVGVFSSKNNALLLAAEFVQQWVMEGQGDIDLRRQISHALNRKDWQGALDLWSEHNDLLCDPERIEIEQTSIDAGVPDYFPSIDIEGLEEELEQT